MARRGRLDLNVQGRVGQRVVIFYNREVAWSDEACMEGQSSCEIEIEIEIEIKIEARRC